MNFFFQFRMFDNWRNTVTLAFSYGTQSFIIIRPASTGMVRHRTCLGSYSIITQFTIRFVDYALKINVIDMPSIHHQQPHIVAIHTHTLTYACVHKHVAILRLSGLH